MRQVITGLLQVPGEVLRHRLGIVRLQVLLVEPAELGHVQARGLRIDVDEVEQRLHLRDREHFLVAVRPAQPHQVVQQRMRQVAGVAVLHHVGRAGALGQLGALLVEDHRQVREVRYGRAQRLVDVDLARRVVDVVVAAHHVGDAHVDVVHHHREVVGGVTVAAEDDEVVELAVGDLDPALDLVVPRDHAIQRVAEADHPVGIVAPARVRIAIGAVVARLVAGSHRRLAHRLEFFLGLVGVIGVAGGDQLFGDLAVAIQPVGLVDRTLVVVQAKPVHRLQDGVDRGLGAALAVGVLDPQDELTALAARLQPAIQRGARAADVEVAGRGRGEAGADGHGDAGSGVRRILACSRRGPLRGSCEHPVRVAAAATRQPQAIRRILRITL